MKKFYVRMAVFFITLILTVILTGRLLNRDQNNMTMEMSGATLPLVTMLCGETGYNRLHGYTEAMEVSAQREHLTVLGEQRDARMLVETFGRQVTSALVEVRSVDGERLVENIPITDLQENDGRIQVDIALKDLVQRREEYMLVLLLELDDWQQVWYYTRAIWYPEAHLSEALDFVLDFHNRLYSREAAKELTKYLETNSKLEDNSSFHKVNIHSSFKQVTWGDMKIREVQAPEVTVSELGDRSTQILLDYRVVSEGENRQTEYRMQEYFRVRYTADRMYLLDYERTMTQIPREENLYAGDKILLGIGDEKVSMMENAGGNVLAFCQADRLFSYHITDKKLALIFGFYDGEQNKDDRCAYDRHDIRILQVDDAGNVFFAVYGYMNRGTHEGRIGVQINKYDAGLNTVEEIAYIPWKRSFSELRHYMETLLYRNEAGMIYLAMDHAVYEVDPLQETVTELFAVEADGAMQVSENHKILVWQEEEFSSDILIQNLESGSRSALHCSPEDALKILAFMGEDIIYGVARREEITYQPSGQLIFPMYEIRIAGADGSVLKEYRQENIFTTDCEVEENQITLERVTRNEAGEYVPVGQDHITKTSQDKLGKNQIAVVDIDVYKRYVQIKVSGKIEAEMVQLLTPKEVIHEGDNDLELPPAADQKSFYAYGPYGVEAVCRKAAKAVVTAYESAGTVTDRSGNIVWEKRRGTRNQIMAIQDPDKTEADQSLAVCLDTMLRLKGFSADSASELAKGKHAEDILKENMTDMTVLDLSGCPLDAMLYYVNLDLPVLAVLRSGEAVLITGFNESQVVIFQPSLGKLYKKNTAETDKWFDDNGNCFLVVLP